MKTHELINTFAAKAVNYEQASAWKTEAQASLNEFLVECKKAGLSFKLASRDGKGAADACPNRKALKEALKSAPMLKLSESRTRDLTAFLVLYYEAGVPVQSTKDYNAVYAALGKERLVALKIEQKQADKDATVIAEHMPLDKQAAKTRKTANRLTLQKGIEVAWQAFKEHPEFGLFERWLLVENRPTFEVYVAQVRANSELEAKRQAFIAQARELGFEIK